MGKMVDLTNKQFGKLMVIKRVEDYISPSGKSRDSQWLCKCECGNEVVKRKSNLCSGSTKSCGCGKAESLIGKTFNMLTVIERDNNKVYSNGKTYVMWKCRCECGNVLSVSALHLKNGHTKSCGCMHRNNAKKLNYSHGGRSKDDPGKNRLYGVWSNMKNRCNNQNCKEYKHYGGRGIVVCEEWEKNFESFCTWAFNNGYDASVKRGKCTLDRINVDGNYCPENCRWVDQKTQCNNTRKNVRLVYNNEEHTLSEWRDITNIPIETIRWRINNGWEIKDVLSIIDDKQRGEVDTIGQ